LENLSRTVRFKELEIELIEEFLSKNPFFDFSSLTRIALVEFIKNPSIQITPVSTNSRIQKKAKLGSKMRLDV
jgi:hypothetical protein